MTIDDNDLLGKALFPASCFDTPIRQRYATWISRTRSLLDEKIDLYDSSKLEFLPSECRLPIQRMRLRRGLVILLPDFDSLIRLTTNQPQSRFIERARKDPTLRIQRPWLRGGVQALVPMARLPIPEGNRSIITTREKDIVFIDAKGIDDCVLAFEVLHEGAFRAFPLLYGVCAPAGERPLDGVLGKRSHALFVMGEHAHRFAGCEVPKPHSGIE